MLLAGAGALVGAGWGWSAYPLVAVVVGALGLVAAVLAARPGLDRRW